MKFLKKLQNSNFNEIKKEVLWLFEYVKEFNLSLILYILAGVLVVVIGFLSNLLSKKLIDVITGFETGIAIPYVEMMIVLMLLKVAANGIVQRIGAKIEIIIHNRIQYDVYCKTMFSSWQSLNNFRSGDLINRLNNDVKVASTSIINWLPSLITKMIQFLGAFFIIFYYDPIMSIFALASAPLIIFSSKFLMKKMRKYNQEMRKLSSDVMSFHNDSFAGIQTIKAFGLTDQFTHNFKNIQSEYKEKSLEYNKFSIYTSSIMSIFSIFISVGCFGWGLFRLWRGDITYGTMVLFIQLAGNLTSSFSGLISLVPSAISATTSAGRIINVIGLPKEQAYEIELNDLTKKAIEEDGLTLSINNLHFSYDENINILNNVSLTVNPGETIAVVGPSGEGKTTLMRLLLGLLDPQSGICKLIDSLGNEYPISSSTRHFFGYVPQGNTILPGTVLKNMSMMNPDASIEEIKNALSKACADEFISDLNERIGEKGNGFSEGQAQRLSIAMALLRPAPILIFDEATAALDVFNARKIITNIMNRNKNQSCIITTHRYSILSICDHVYQIKNNQLVKLSKEDIVQLERIF